jgi:hypothetical protein
MLPLAAKVQFSEKLKAYMDKKDIHDMVTSVYPMERANSGAEIWTRPLIKEKEIERYERSKYQRFLDGEYRLFVSLDLVPVDKIIKVDLRRFLGAPDFKVDGLALIFSAGGGGGGGGGHKEKVHRQRQGAADPLRQGV